MTDMRWISSAAPFQYGTSKMRTSPPTRAASWRAPSAFVRSVRPMQKRSGRNHRVSPPSTVPGASIQPDKGIPAARVQASSASGSGIRLGLPGRRRIDPRSVTSNGSKVYTRSGLVSSVSRTWTRGPRLASVATNESCSRRATSRSTGCTKWWAGSSYAAPNAAPGRLTSTSRNGADMLWAPKRRIVAVIAGRIVAGDLAMSIRRGTLGRMSGYAASARLRGGAPRFVATGIDGVRVAEVADAAATAQERDGIADEVWIELVGRPLDERLAAWFADLRETWAQATFFLFDPESWR